MNLDPTPTPADLAALQAARRDFPRYQIDVEPIPGHRRYIARRTQPGAGPHTLITSDLTELRRELATSEHAPQLPRRRPACD